MTWTNSSHTVENNPSGSSVEVFDSGFLGPTGSTFSHTFTVVGDNDYYCRIHGAGSMSGTISVENNLGVDDAAKTNFKILLNPTSQMLSLTLPQHIQNGLLSIHDILGKKALTQDFNNKGNNLLEVNISSLAKGMYLITLESNGNRQVKRFLKL